MGGILNLNMKKLAGIIALLIFQLFLVGRGERLCAQVLVNNGGLIFSTNDTIYTNGGVSNEANGTFSNSGQLYINSSGSDPGYWSNIAGNAGFTNSAGVQGASTITCYLIGGNQNIEGNATTEFHNLRLRGSGIKQLNGVDAIVHDTLDLSTFELATGTNRLYVTNTDPNAIENVHSQGFVSSLAGGFLARNTAQASRYVFPVGSSIGQFRYRPVEVAPVNSASNQYAVRFFNDMADNDVPAYPVAQRQATMSRVNEYYYHNITREQGASPADITIYYDAASDGPTTGIAHWQNAPQWEDIVSSPDAPNYGYSSYTRQAWDFSNTSPAFALMKLINECGEMFVPTAFSPDGNGENDMECVYGKCVEELYFAIYDRWGEKVFETTDMTQCWDGTYRGRQMNTAVFVFYMKANLTDGTEVVKKGNISLIR
jgi:gliding motility-associated-like protein